MTFSKALKHLFLPVVYWMANLLFTACRRTLPKQKQFADGINFIGYYAGELGLGQALRSAILAAKAVSIPFGVRQMTMNLLSRQDDLSIKSYVEPHASRFLNCICMNPDMLYRLPLWLDHKEWSARYNVGYWFWELSTFPQSWRYAQHLIDEIWVNTDFIAQAVAPLNRPVYKIPFAIEFDCPAGKWTRDYFSLPSAPFLFLFSFDFHSFIARKNPQAVIAAFKLAFPSGMESAFLVIKTSNSTTYPEQRRMLEEAIQGDSRIVIMDVQLSNPEMRGLLSVADCYISLHRSEGLGLGLAESMYLGKPVIATAYSGNLEFMNTENSALVSYELIPVQKGEYPFAEHQVWADPNIVEAADCMRRMATDRDYCAYLGRNAAAYMREYHSSERMGQAMQERLTSIAAQLPK
jgi:glycosyltransferase involved in cell wall biosynthesis